jgi:ubiquinone/menaquinone biosynthesis C-methylase UbiE
VASTAVPNGPAVSSATDRFARTAAQVAARQDARAERLAEQVRAFVRLRGDERALDVGTGAGALAIALAPLVASVVALDPVPELLALARERALPNVELVEGDGTALPFADETFDLAATQRTLHHVQRPDRVVAELARVTRPRGQVLVIDQLAPPGAGEAAAVHAFEQARDPSHARLLSETELRELFAANGLRPVRERVEREQRELGSYLELAGCSGDERTHAEALAAADPRVLPATVGWYLLSRV